MHQDFHKLTTAFREDGFLLVESVLSDEICTALRAEVDRVVAMMTAGSEIDTRVHFWVLPSGEFYLFKIKPIIDLSPEIAALQYNPVLELLLKGLFLEKSVLIEDKLMLKQVMPLLTPPGHVPTLGAKVHRHLDSAYFLRRGLSNEVVSSAFLLDDCDATSGPLRVWPGSHKMQIPVIDGGVHGPIVSEAFAPEVHARSLVGPAGSLILWHSRLIHDSLPNCSERPRRLVVFGHDYRKS